jgi:uncharacterized protein (DUF1684 family)
VLTRFKVFLLACIAASCSQPPAPPASYAGHAAEINAWRADRDAGLRKPDGWLTLIGLFWLHPGENNAGSAPDNSVVFPKDSPARLGTFTLDGGKVRFDAEPGVEITMAAERVSTVALDPLAADGPILEFGSLSFHALERAGQIGIRLRDRDSPALTAFSGMENFPIEVGWRITARFKVHDEPKRIKVPNIAGTAFDELVYGKLIFDFEGARYSLDPLYKPEDGFFVVFGDETNGHETYGGGRFLATDPPAGDGTVILDFNTAYNPPCVFTPYATCPLPPAPNKLPIRIAAGETMYRGSPATAH